MPFGFSGAGPHDNGLHMSNAARNGAGGVKGIDAAGNLDPQIVMADIDATILNAASGIPGLDAAGKITSRLTYEGAASGVAPLDAAAKFAGITASDIAGVVASGTYAGNSTANRAVAHGLGRTPRFVLIVRRAVRAHFVLLTSGNIAPIENSATGSQPVTAADATNFYVGNATQYDNSANSGNDYDWIAIG